MVLLRRSRGKTVMCAKAILDYREIFSSNCYGTSTLFTLDIRQYDNMCHDDSDHFGLTRTLDLARKRFHRSSLRRDIRSWVKKCSWCLTRKNTVPNHVTAPMITVDSSKFKTFQKLSIDILGPCTSRNRQQIHTRLLFKIGRSQGL